MQLIGRDVVVTGGSRGIGLAIACEFARRGNHVHVLARRQAHLDRALEAIAAQRADSELRLGAIACDVADPDAVESACHRLADAGIAVSVLVNCAGIVHPGYFEKLPLAVFETLMRVNYLGTVHPTRCLVPSMIERGEGYVVNVSSLAGLMGVFGYTAYSASKFAVRGFTEALRAELRPRGIAVSLLCPPDTDTPGLEAERELMPPETRALNASAGVLRPEAVARALLRGMRRRAPLIVPGREARLVAWAHRHLPRLVDRIVDARLARAGTPSSVRG